jgi:hypothetical protein
MADQTISFCTTSRGPAARLRALLEIVRPYVDEIVVAVDRNGDPDNLQACADLADRRLTFELHSAPGRLVGWIMHQASSDWILRLDDDEVPSAALLSSLRHIIADRYPSEIALKRRWLFPTPDRYLACPPWGYDFNQRLVRNSPGLWRFEGRVHTAGTVLGERRLLELPLYHLVLLTMSLKQRRRKAVFYESERTGATVDGWPVNAMYVPEVFPDLEGAVVPDPDRPLIQKLLDAASSQWPALDGSPVDRASVADVDRFNATRKVPDDAYRSSISFVRPPTKLPAAAVHHHEVLVHNLGSERWPPGDQIEPLIRLGYRWREAETQHIVGDGRTVFTETVRPGQTTRVMLRTATPNTPGTYELELDVVHEHVRWFDQPVRIPIAIEEDYGQRALGGAALSHGPFADADQAERRRIEHELRNAQRQGAELLARVSELESFQQTRRYRFAMALGRAADYARDRFADEFRVTTRR